MITQIKKWGDSNVLILSKEFLKFHELKEGDWVDVSDIIKVNKKGKSKNKQEVKNGI